MADANGAKRRHSEIAPKMFPRRRRRPPLPPPPPPPPPPLLEQMASIVPKSGINPTRVKSNFNGLNPIGISDGADSADGADGGRRSQRWMNHKKSYIVVFVRSLRCI